jgi:hypothetical protein
MPRGIVAPPRFQCFNVMPDSIPAVANRFGMPAFFSPSPRGGSQTATGMMPPPPYRIIRVTAAGLPALLLDTRQGCKPTHKPYILRKFTLSDAVQLIDGFFVF